MKFAHITVITLIHTLCAEGISDTYFRSSLNIDAVSFDCQYDNIVEADNGIKTNLSKLKSQNTLKTGTTIVGLCCKDCVILGSDTRSTGGPLIMDKAKLKLHKISDYIYCCAAGTSADCDQITKETSHRLALLKNDLPLSTISHFYEPISSALHFIRKIMQMPRGNSNSKDDRKSSVILLGGYDTSEYIGYQLYAINDQGVATRVTYAAYGSGSTDAIAVLENYLYHKNGISHHNKEATSKDSRQIYVTSLSKEEGIHAIREAVTAGILNDLGSGNSLDICVIEKEKVTSWREIARRYEGALENNVETTNSAVEKILYLDNKTPNTQHEFPLLELRQIYSRHSVVEKEHLFQLHGAKLLNKKDHAVEIEFI